MLISEEYKALQVRKHIDKPSWGKAAAENIVHIRDFCVNNNITEVLDYGCGKQRLRDGLAAQGVTVHGYDPGIPEVDKRPAPCDTVMCLDVLEHVEPECVDAVLDDIQGLLKRIGLFTIGTTPAKTLLHDGSNAHRTIKPVEWWVEKLKARFGVVHVFTVGETGFGVVVE